MVVTSEGHAKILDFGIVKVSESETLTAQGMVLGTAHAMSPEQARGGEVDARSDLFSLGTLLYEMLTGSSPFRGSNSLDELQRVISHSPPPVSSLRPEVPAALSELVKRLLAKSREERPRGADTVARELAVLSSLPELSWGAPGLPPGAGSTQVEIPPSFVVPGTVRLPVTSLHSRRLPVVLLGALVAVIALSSVWLLRRGSPPSLRVAVLAPGSSPRGRAPTSWPRACSPLPSTISPPWKDWRRSMPRRPTGRPPPWRRPATPRPAR